jgi:hypothetical protein
VFSPEIKRVLTSHDELACTMSGEGRQEMSIPASKATYDFDVEFACGTMHDPKIIVSPIKGG